MKDSFKKKDSFNRRVPFNLDQEFGGFPISLGEEKQVVINL